MAVDAERAATGLIEQARAANSMGRPAAAEKLLRRAIRSLARPDASPAEQRLRATATVVLASPVFERRGLEPAVALLREADQLVDGPEGDGVRVLSRVQRAGLLARCGEWQVAVDELADLGETSRWLSTRQLVSVHLNRATARHYLGDHRRSLEDLETALRLAQDGGLADLEFKARSNLGYSRFVAGDVPAALRLMAEADRMDVEVARATAKRDYAHVLLESGLLDEAATLLAEAITIAAERRLHQEVGEILLDSARLELLRGRPGHADDAARAAARLFRRRGAHGWWVQAEILHAEAVLARGTSSAAASRLATRLEGLPTRSRAVHLEALLVATEASLAAGSSERAQALFAQARGVPTSPAGRLRQDWLASRLALAGGDPRRARRRLREAADRVAEQQDRPASLDARTAFALHARRLVGLDVAVALETGSAAQVLSASERWRAATARLPSLVPHPDDQLDELFSRLRSLRAQLRDAADPSRTDRLARTAEEVERAIRRREWELSDHDRAVRPGRPASGHAARAHADATGTDMLCLFAADDRLRAVTISADGMRLHDVGDADAIAEQTRRLLADVAMAGRRLTGGLGTVVRRSLDRRLADLAAVLPVPRTRSRLVIVSTRVLRSVPWRLIPGIGDRAVVVTPSVTSWMAGDHRPPGGPPRAVALAGPGLSRASTEAAAVAAAWGPGAVSVPGATGADLTAALVDADVVHVAAHGHHHDQNPLFSAVALHDGPLFAYELQRRGVRAGHVVLSACDTGRAMMRPGDESVGLTSSLLACGAQSVVAAVAPVDDVAAAELMAGYHRRLRTGQSSAQALQQAAAEATDPWQAGLFCTYGTDWTGAAQP